MDICVSVFKIHSKTVHRKYFVECMSKTDYLLFEVCFYPNVKISNNICSLRQHFYSYLLQYLLE